jgi:hypothetical protein
MISLADGIGLGERVAMNLPGEVAEGGRIQPIAAAAKRAAPAASRN